MARAASLSESRWLPAYGWWPRSDLFSASVIIAPHHATDDPSARFRSVIRGYAGSPQALWERDVGELGYGDVRVLPLSELEVPEPPSEQGAVLEVHTVRLDKQPPTPVHVIGMWIEAVAPDGGGYLIPTQPIRGAHKVVARDDVQVVPGIIETSDTSTELLLISPLAETVTVKLVAFNAAGLSSEGKEFQIEPYSAFYEPLRRRVPNLRKLLADGDGVGSLAIYSNHRLLPNFGFRKDGGPIGSMDHTAPIFAA